MRKLTLILALVALFAYHAAAQVTQVSGQVLDEENGEPLTAEDMCNAYYELNKKYYGRAIEHNELIRYEWARIPHFYTPFYVYQYATGFSAAISIATRILAGDKQTLSGYMKFLSSGGSMHPIDLLKLCGVDMEQPYVVEEALQEFGKYLKLFND